jgi:predicted nucleotidyltransferase
VILRKKDKDRIITIAKDTLKTPSQLWAYGSRVNGDAHDTSDLDMVIVTSNNEKLNISELMDFKNALQQSNIPILTQVLDWNRIPKSFHKNILNHYEVLSF